LADLGLIIGGTSSVDRSIRDFRDVPYIGKDAAIELAPSSAHRPIAGAKSHICASQDKGPNQVSRIGLVVALSPFIKKSSEPVERMVPRSTSK
jgi:hypothetical protein